MRTSTRLIRSRRKRSENTSRVKMVRMRSSLKRCFGKPQMIPPSTINILPSSTISSVQSELKICHTDNEGKVTVELPEWASDARVTIEAHAPNGRRGVLQKNLDIPR